jgi:cell surface protein SprA
MDLALSDIGRVSFSGRKETAGFGALDQSLQQRRNDDYSSLHLTLSMELGWFLPGKAKITAPFYYSYSSQTTAPLYDPFNRDILLAESMKHIQKRDERDSVRLITVTHTTRRSLSLSNVKMNIKSGKPMPYDPANFSFGYTANEHRHQSPDTEYATTKDFRLQADYSYSPAAEPWEPFSNLKKRGWTKLLQSVNFNYLPNNIAISSNLMRNYGETQLRDLNAYAQGITETQRHYLSFSRNFYWDRDLYVTWDLTRNLKTSFRSGTVAEIEEPYLQVNREINRSDYEIWKDSVMMSIRDLGKPLSYEQTADVTYILPFTQIPLLDWVTSSVAYNSRYRWERGAIISDETIGNTLQNDLSLTLNSRFNLVSLYNKIPFLQLINSRFNVAGSTQQEVQHEGGGTGKDMAHYLARAVMILRQFSLNTGYKTRTYLPGYDPMIGDYFGQQRTPSGLLPGLGFAFGLEGGERFIRESMTHNRLVINENNIRPAIWNETSNLRLDATLEPFPGMRIELSTLYEKNNRTEFQYMVEGMPEIRGGSFAMSTLSISSAFENGRAGNSYRSPAFEQFRNNREVVAARLREQYSETRYPSGGFLSGSSLSGEPFSSTTGDVNPNRADVLIPSFLAAYTGRGGATIALTPFPDLSAMLPNWDLSLNLTTIAPQLQQQFQSFIISHSYISQYRVGSFSSHLSWVPLSEGSDLGYIRDVVSGAPLPSSPFDIQAVSIMESFNPLIELSVMLHNNVSLSFRINRTRALNLNISSLRIVEMNDNDIVLGMGYRIAHFNRIIGFGSNTWGKRRRRTAPERERETAQTLPAPAFSNDLNIRVDISGKNTQALIRKIEDGFTQATSGISTTTIRFSADYAMSRALTLRAFFDKIINRPQVSSTAYPTANTSAGLSLRFNFD